MTNFFSITAGLTRLLLVSIFFFSLLTAKSVADDGGLRGIVLDSQTTEPIPGAIVTICATKQSVQTDADGRFALAGSNGRAPEVRISAIGYKQTTMTIAPDEYYHPVKIRLTSIPMSSEMVTPISSHPVLKSIPAIRVELPYGCEFDDLSMTEPSLLRRAFIRGICCIYCEAAPQNLL